jgi:hypothetical protein
MPSSSPPSSSSSTSSHQSSLYQYYTPIASNEPTPSRVLQPSTTHNRPFPNNRSRITVKRPLHQKDTSHPITKKLKISSVQQDLAPPITPPLRRHVLDTVPRSLLMRGLNGHRASLSQRHPPPLLKLISDK